MFSKMISVFSNLDPANSVVLHEDWFIKAAKPLVAFCAENLPCVKTSGKKDIKEMYEM